MAETGMGRGKRKGAASIPRVVPSRGVVLKKKWGTPGTRLRQRLTVT